MKFHIKKYFLFLFLISAGFSFSQADTSSQRGTIKIVKPKQGEVYIKVITNFNKFNLTKIKDRVARNEMYEPFPIVGAYPFPFNYNAYFNNCFRSTEIDMKGKETDTVTIEVTILENGKAYVKDKSPSLMVKGVPATYDDKTGAYELNNQHLNCLKFLKQINKWFPGYVVFPQKDKFRGSVVIKPNKKNVDVTGTITVYFSTIPFED